MTIQRFCLTLSLVSATVGVAAANDYSQFNYPSRRAFAAHVCPHLVITSFSFGNTYARGGTQFASNYSWRNDGAKEIVAFEIAELKYDPFNRPLIGSRAIVPGHNSGSYSPLKPGEKASDGTISYGSEQTFTVICYVRHVRFADGTVWTVDDAALLKEVKRLVPDILNVGPLEPPQKKGEAKEG
jgi:hypothetical protein